MEALLPIVISLILVPLSLYVISFILKNGSTKYTKNLPPGSMGWPLLGETIEYGILGPEKFIRKRMAKYSDEVFKSSLFGQNVAIFCGAQANKFIFMNENKLVTFWFPRLIQKAMGFPEFMENSIKDSSLITHRFTNDFVKPEALKRLLLNIVDPEQIQKLFDPFNLINEGMFSLPIDFPGTGFNRAIKGSKKVREELVRIIKERRKELAIMKQNKEMITSTDVLSEILIQGKHEDLSDEEICYSMIALVLASYETSSSTISSVMNFLAQLPHIYEKVFKEQVEIAKSKGPDELLTWQDVEKMKYSWNVVRESLRSVPPAFGGFREATQEFTYAGFTIPKGWKTLWSVHSSQLDPNCFPEPEKFDPSRFEGSGPTPHTFVPFGGGPRMCPGKEYARLLILVFLHNVVTRFKFKKAIPDEKISERNILPAPVYGFPVHLYPHEK